MSTPTPRNTDTRETIYWVWLWGPIIAYCALIFLGSAQQNLSPPDFPSSDKVAHFFEYGVLGILWARAAKTTWPHQTFTWLLISTALFTGLYGVTDETHQLYVPGRFSDRYDALADLCGGTIGGVVYLLVICRKIRSPRLEHVKWSKVDLVDKE
jgi:VanZ family protein